MYTYIYVHTYICVQTYVHACIDAYTHVYNMHIQAHLHTCNIPYPITVTGSTDG